MQARWRLQQSGWSPKALPWSVQGSTNQAGRIDPESGESFQGSPDLGPSLPMREGNPGRGVKRERKLYWEDQTGCATEYFWYRSSWDEVTRALPLSTVRGLWNQFE